MELIVLSGVSALAGALVTYLMSRPKRAGVLRVDRSDPDGPYLFVELAKDVADICEEQYVTFEVVAKDFISRK
jgi:hypothetical protein